MPESLLLLEPFFVLRSYTRDDGCLSLVALDVPGPCASGRELPVDGISPRAEPFKLSLMPPVPL